MGRHAHQHLRRALRDGGRFKLDKDATTASYARARRRPARDRAPRRGRAAERSGPRARAQGDRNARRRRRRGTRWACAARAARASSWRPRAPRRRSLPGSFADAVGADDGPVLAHPVVGGVARHRERRVSRARRAFVRAEARKKPGTVPPKATRLARLSADVQLLRNSVHGAGRRVRRRSCARPTGMEELLDHRLGAQDEQHQGRRRRRWRRRSSTRRCRSSASPATRTTPSSSVGRQYRDSLSAALMISNDRIFGEDRVDAARLQGR